MFLYICIMYNYVYMNATVKFYLINNPDIYHTTLMEMVVLLGIAGNLIFWILLVISWRLTGSLTNQLIIICAGNVKNWLNLIP